MEKPKQNPVYLDANACYPMHASVKKRLKDQLDTAVIGNPASIHRHGAAIRHAVAAEREALADFFGVWPEQLVFTSSGTEANQTVLRAMAQTSRQVSHLLISAVEHDSVRRYGAKLKQEGVLVTELQVGMDGQLDWSALDAIQKQGPPLSLLSVGWVNAETGVIQDIERLVAWRDKNAPYLLMHVDAAQAWGKLSINPTELGVDFLTFSGHKIGAPSGIGLLWMKPRTPFQPLLEGSQEKYRRGGTENVLGILGLGAAVTEVPYMMTHASKIERLRRVLESKVLSEIPGVRINGGSSPRVYNTSNFSFTGLQGESLVIGCDLEGFSVSAGSACSSGSLLASHVLQAMQVPEQEARSSLRVSFWHENTETDVERFVVALSALVARLRQPNRWQSTKESRPGRIWSRHA